MNSLLEVFQCIFLLDLNRPHQHRLSAINFSDNFVNHDTRVVDLASPKGVEGSLDRVHSIERAGESGMKVDDRNAFPLNLFKKSITKNMHPARQNDEIWRRGQHDLGNLVIVIIPPFSRVGFEVGL